MDESDSEESVEVPRQKEFPTEAAVGTAVALNSLRSNAEVEEKDNPYLSYQENFVNSKLLIIP